MPKLLKFVSEWLELEACTSTYEECERRISLRRPVDSHLYWLKQLKYILLESNTVAVRFWFGLISLVFGISLTLGAIPLEYYTIFKLIDSKILAVVFTVHGVSLLYGALTQRYSVALLCLEGVLGVVAWGSLGIYTSLTQGFPGYTLMASCIALWLLIRYPTWRKH